MLMKCIPVPIFNLFLKEITKLLLLLKKSQQLEESTGSQIIAFVNLKLIVFKSNTFEKDLHPHNLVKLMRT